MTDIYTDLPANVTIRGDLEPEDSPVSLLWFDMETNITSPYYVEGPYPYDDAMDVIVDHLPDQNAEGRTTVQIHPLRHRKHNP